MPDITFQIPTEVIKILSNHPEIKWDRIVTESLWNYAKKLRLMDKIASKSKLSSRDVNVLDKSIKAGMMSRYQGRKCD
jgi:hypothetical protein